MTATGDDAHLVVMGVAGSGKTTVAGLLARRLGLELAEADDFHPAANVAKMHAGIPLTDTDRAPWLLAIRDWLDEHSGGGRHAVVTCSALKRAYRDVLRTAHSPVRFVHLDGPRALLEDRISARQGHFMPASMLDSQLDTLEPLEPDEDGFTVGIGPAPEAITDEIVARLGLR